MREFREAVEAGDLRRVEGLLADDVRFTSPVAFQPYDGKPITAAILRAAFRVFEDFHYVREIGSTEGRDHALVFEAKIDGTSVNGCDFLHVGDDGLIDDFMVMVRPLSGAKALAEAMGAQFEQVVAEASADSGAEAGADPQPG